MNQAIVVVTPMENRISMVIPGAGLFLALVLKLLIMTGPRVIIRF